MVLASNREPSNFVLFSTNGGVAFERCTFLNRNVTTINVVAAARGTGKEFLLYTDDGTLVHIDFGTLPLRACVGADAPDAADSDFETFAVGSACLLGERRRFVRKKPTVSCRNDATYERTLATTRCACARQNYRCDECFAADTNGTCVLNAQCARAKFVNRAVFG